MIKLETFELSTKFEDCSKIVVCNLISDFTKLFDIALAVLFRKIAYKLYSQKIQDYQRLLQIDSDSYRLLNTFADFGRFYTMTLSITVFTHYTKIGR